jgi:tetratricopeptide (TPR) repeat protein
MTGDHLLWAARSGGGHIRGELLRQIDGRWLAHRMRVVLSPVQVAEAHELLRQENAAAAEARQREAAKREAELQVRIAAWRVLAAKPPLPAEAQRYKALAEKAEQANRFDEARGHYEKALEIEPLWPQGQFRKAQLDAESKAYRSAIRHMRLYLELVPDAQDGLAARARLRAWEQDDLKKRP